MSLLAATRLIALHRNKEKSIARCLKDRIDYARNGEKTEDGRLISAYACTPETADREFILSKQEYLRITGRQVPGDIIAYQIRQSFKPGEISPEEANQVGYETAIRFTKGNHAFLVATHTDREHIHNHIIFNSTNLTCDRKFRDAWFVALALQRLSDIVCLEHCLSVITPRKPGERDNHSPYHRTSFRSILREEINRIMYLKPKTYEDFLRELQNAGYELKRGKHISVCGKGQKRFIRLKSLGEHYSEENLRQRIEEGTTLDANVLKHVEIRESSLPSADCKKFDKRRSSTTRQEIDLLIDINRKLIEGKGKGYELWAKKFNLQQMAKVLKFLQEHEIRDYTVLVEKADSTAAAFHQLQDAIKARESKLRDIAELKMQIVRYVKTREIYEAYRTSGYSKRYFEEHRDEISLHKAAKEYFNRKRLSKFPAMKELSFEYGQILKEKQALYADFHAAKKEMMAYRIAKHNIDLILQQGDTKKTKRREKELNLGRR
nr:relaxase/mobilization nuclease domain-containing protein [Stomatobaculum longum]